MYFDVLTHKKFKDVFKCLFFFKTFFLEFSTAKNYFYLQLFSEQDSLKDMTRSFVLKFRIKFAKFSVYFSSLRYFTSLFCFFFRCLFAPFLLLVFSRVAHFQDRNPGKLHLHDRASVISLFFEFLGKDLLNQ